MNVTPHRPRRSRAALVVAAVLAASCAEPSTVARAARSATPTEIVPRLVVADSGGPIVVVTLALDAGPSVARVGSFTARVTWDSTAATFLDELAPGDGALRATNPSPGTVRVAGASALGIDVARLAVFRLTLHGGAARTALARATVELEELHEQARGDLKPLVQRRPGAAP